MTRSRPAAPSSDETAKTILVVDDDRSILLVLEARLESAGFNVITAQNGRKALEILDDTPVDLVLSDVRMPGLSGMELLRELRARGVNGPLVLMTAYGTIPDAVEAMKLGAIDYVTKPFDGQALLAKIRKLLVGGAVIPQQVIREKTGASENGDSRKPSGPPEVENVLWGGISPASRDLSTLIKRVAPTDVNVLILGESGTGKERIAHLIHELSPRRGKPLVIVDCGSTPTTLLESELFGHVKGAFTHAVRDKKGLIEEADGGTLFLDEIGNISPEMQLRLLRFLESRKIRRIGDLKEIPVECRVIAATNSDLAKDVKKGAFREDLYYRLKVITIKAPPLRDRREDIPLLARKFVETFCEQHKLPVPELPPETVEKLLAHAWPGNVRELKNSLEAAVVLSIGGRIEPETLDLEGMDAMDGPLDRAEGEKPIPGLPAPAAADEDFSLDESEKKAIIKALEKARWVQKDAAEILGISRRAIHYKVKKYGIVIQGRTPKPS